MSMIELRNGFLTISLEHIRAGISFLFKSADEDGSSRIDVKHFIETSKRSISSGKLDAASPAH